MAENSAEKRRIAEKALGREMPGMTQISPELIDSLRLFVIDRRLDQRQTRLIFSKEVASMVEVPENSVPVEIFRNKKLSALESIVKYLKEERGFGFSGVAKLTERSSKTIWATYSNAAKKMPEKFSFANAILPSIHVPLSILKDRKLGVQEAIVKYLREDAGLNYHRIAVILNRNDRTIWTVYDRIRKKSAISEKDNPTKTADKK